MPTNRRWPGLALVSMAFGVLLLAAPASVEGPVLVPISPGHALSALDAVGVVPLTVGSFTLYAGLWKRRERLHALARQSPAIFTAGVFTSGFGLGLLLASAFSGFFWWWAIGAVVFGMSLLWAVLAAR